MDRKKVEEIETGAYGEIVMNDLELKFEKINYQFPMVYVEGTGGKSYLFGEGSHAKEIDIKDFFISKFPVTQTLYEHITGFNPAHNKGTRIPVECVSYNDLAMENGFLEKLNANKSSWGIHGEFRLPSETEWEYAAKGGIHWIDGLIFSGSNNISEVGWYKDNSLDQSEPVGLKKSNQLGIYDMSGNIWEWCQDYFHEEVTRSQGTDPLARKKLRSVFFVADVFTTGRYIARQQNDTK